MVSDIEHIVATLLLLIGGQHWGVLQWLCNCRTHFWENRSVGTKVEVVTQLSRTQSGYVSFLFFFRPLTKESRLKCIIVMETSPLKMEVTPIVETSCWPADCRQASPFSCDSLDLCLRGARLETLRGPVNLAAFCGLSSVPACRFCHSTSFSLPTTSFHIILHVTFTSFRDIELSVIVGDGGKVDKQITKSGSCTDATRIAST
jgi:hypothetical protein